MTNETGTTGTDGGGDPYAGTALAGAGNAATDDAGSGADDGANEFGFDIPEGLDDGDVEIAKKFFDGLELGAHGNELLTRYASMVAENDTEAQAADDTARDSALNELAKTWGADFTANLGRLRTAVDALPFADDLANARLGNGELLFNSPAAVQWLAGLIGGTKMTNNTQPTNAALIAERQAIEKTMRENRGEYNRDKHMQDRYLEIITKLEPQ